MKVVWEQYAERILLMSKLITGLFFATIVSLVMRAAKNEVAESNRFIAEIFILIGGLSVIVLLALLVFSIFQRLDVLKERITETRRLENQALTRGITAEELQRIQIFPLGSRRRQSEVLAWNISRHNSSRVDSGRRVPNPPFLLHCNLLQ